MASNLARLGSFLAWPDLSKLRIFPDREGGGHLVGLDFGGSDPEAVLPLNLLVNEALRSWTLPGLHIQAINFQSIRHQVTVDSILLLLLSPVFSLE